MPSAIREEIVRVALNKSSALIDYKVYNDIPKQTEFRKQIILDDKFLTSEEKTEAIGIINKSYDHDKILYNFAVWIDGCYNEWDPNEKRLKRFGRQKVILKSLENDENINRNWFEEAKSHLTLSNEWQSSVQYYGLTQDPSNAIQSEETNDDVNKKSANYTDGNLHTSKVYQFENLPEPRNATEEEQEAFRNKSYDNSDNIGFNKTNNQDEDIRNKTIQQQIKDNIDEDEVYVNPNLHSEEQDELEIPDSI
ncbi:kinase-like domain-containing protein [Rhizophagus irregularis DAOM 181602=DAOM 197198]|nr:kinase-like domain-containing protein [Rhizophagus irregularis DAOM 181602=DAOM 197198]